MLFSLPHHEDFSVALRVEFQWRLVDWISYSHRNNQGVVGIIP
jgi:hypothetical protein